MSRDYNRVILMGRLARDPEVRMAQSGWKNARVSIACGREWKDKVTGEKKSETEFHPVVAWGVQAEVLERYCKKGKLLLIEGRLHSYSYDDRKSGAKKYATEVVADNIVMLADGKSGQAAPVYSAPASAQRRADAGSLRGDFGFDDDSPLDFSDLDGGSVDADIPF